MATTSIASLSTSLLTLVARLSKQVNNAVTVVTLDDNLTILGRATHSAALLKLLAQLGKIIATAHEATHYGSHATTLKSVEPNLEILPLRSEGLGLGLLGGVLCKVGICREYNAQSIFPVACHSINFEFFYTKIVKIL